RPEDASEQWPPPRARPRARALQRRTGGGAGQGWQPTAGRPPPSLRGPPGTPPSGSRARPGAEGPRDGLEDVTISSILQDVTSVNDRLVDLFISPAEQDEASRQGPRPSGVLREVTSVNDRLIDMFLSSGGAYHAAAAAAAPRGGAGVHSSYPVPRSHSGEARSPTRSHAEASKDADVTASQELQAYLVDNSALNASTRGLSYRRSKDMKDADGERFAEWNSIVNGVDDGDGWVRVGDRFLPLQIGGAAVLRPLEPQQAARLRGSLSAPAVAAARERSKPHPALVDAELQRLRRVSADQASQRAEQPAPVTGERCAQRHGADPFQEDLVLPVGAVLRGLQATERCSAARRTPLHLMYVVLFTSTVSLALDVPSAFEAQRGVLQGLGGGGAAGAGAGEAGAPPAPRVRFENVSSLAEFWGWAAEALYPQVFEAERFNNLGNGSEAVFAVAKYNHVVTPVRFRQLRARSGQCTFPADSHALSQPCWVDYGPGRAEAGPLGSLDVEDGHAVDLELNSSLALGRLQGMVADRLSAHVEACSCSLSPYAGLWGEVHLILEVCWAVAYVAYLVYAVIDTRNGKRIIWFLEDKDEFRQQHKTEFKDLYTLCERFQFTRGCAGFGTLWLFMLTTLRVRNYSRLRLIFLTLTNSAGVMIQVCFAVLVSATPFAFAGYWLFGGRVYAFSSWPRAFGFLFRSVTEGLVPRNDRRSLGPPSVLEEMRQNGPIMADVLSVSWVLVCKLLFYGMFVACGVNSFRTAKTVWARRREQLTEHGSYNLRDFLFADFLKKFTFPSLREPAELYQNDIRVWKSCLEQVRRADLESLVGEALRRDQRALEVRDVMPLFRKRADSEFDTYRRASLWVRGLRSGLQDAAGWERAPSAGAELRALLRRVASLEEETMGLTLQLHGNVAEVPLAAPI
ncbi:unnamed protein product, partial [Prorocentrum cordatum]